MAFCATPEAAEAAAAQTAESAAPPGAAEQRAAVTQGRCCRPTMTHHCLARRVAPHARADARRRPAGTAAWRHGRSACGYLGVVEAGLHRPDAREHVAEEQHLHDVLTHLEVAVCRGFDCECGECEYTSRGSGRGALLRRRVQLSACLTSHRVSVSASVRVSVSVSVNERAYS